MAAPDSFLINKKAESLMQLEAFIVLQSMTAYGSVISLFIISKPVTQQIYQSS